jgi:hypothetical protein
MPQIHFNGKTYNDLAEMPATERQAYEQLTALFKDENQDGIPDMFQGDIIGNLLNAAATKVMVDGKQVSGLGEMSPEQRAKFQKGMAKLKELGIISQVPDLSSESQAASWENADIRPSQPIIPTRSAIEEDTGGRVNVLVALLAALVVCGAGVVIFFILGQGQ